MKRSTLAASIGAALLLAGATTVLAAGRAATRAATEPPPAASPAWCAPAVNTVAGSDRKGRDGAACSSGDECQSGTCEGGSCCTAHEDTCDSSSHCCGHQSCGSDGKCP